MNALDAATARQEHLILEEIGSIADNLRELRRSDAVTHSALIKTLTADMQTKWTAMRVLRAPPVSELASLPEAGKRHARPPQQLTRLRVQPPRLYEGRTPPTA